MSEKKTEPFKKLKLIPKETQSSIRFDGTTAKMPKITEQLDAFPEHSKRDNLERTIERLHGRLSMKRPNNEPMLTPPATCPDEQLPMLQECIHNKFSVQRSNDAGSRRGLLHDRQRQNRLSRSPSHLDRSLVIADVDNESNPNGNGNDSGNNGSNNDGNNEDNDPARPEGKRYKLYPMERMNLAIMAVNGGMSGLKASRMYGLPSRTVYYKVRKLKIQKNGANRHLQRGQRRQNGQNAGDGGENGQKAPPSHCRPNDKSASSSSGSYKGREINANGNDGGSKIRKNNGGNKIRTNKSGKSMTRPQGKSDMFYPKHRMELAINDVICGEMKALQASVVHGVPSRTIYDKVKKMKEPQPVNSKHTGGVSKNGQQAPPSRRRPNDKSASSSSGIGIEHERR